LSVALPNPDNVILLISASTSFVLVIVSVPIVNALSSTFAVISLSEPLVVLGKASALIIILYTKEPSILPSTTFSPVVLLSARTFNVVVAFPLPSTVTSLSLAFPAVIAPLILSSPVPPVFVFVQLILSPLLKLLVPSSISIVSSIPA